MKMNVTWSTISQISQNTPVYCEYTPLTEIKCIKFTRRSISFLIRRYTKHLLLHIIIVTIVHFVKSLVMRFVMYHRFRFIICKPIQKNKYTTIQGFGYFHRN